MHCWVYKSLKKSDHFIYFARPLDEIEEEQRPPAGLMSMLGELEFVLDLELKSDTKLAQASANHVLRDIEQQGFYLQLPKKDMLALENDYFS